MFECEGFKYKLVFRYEGRTTWAILLGEDTTIDALNMPPRWEELAVGTSRRSPKDQDERALGRLIAFRRLLDDIRNKEVKRAASQWFFSNCKMPRGKH